MSKDHEYLYPYSAQEAKKRNQLPMWRESYHANVACRNAIEETIRQNFNGMNLKKDCLEPVLAEYGYEAALIRFEARMGSAIISDIVRGLVGILRGDDGRMYFQMLSHDLKALELQRLKAKAAKIPPKIRVFSFLMLMCFMLTYIVIKVPYIGELICDTDCPAVEDYNDFAEALEDIWQQDGALLTYAAVLEAERPDTLRGACELLRNLDN